MTDAEAASAWRELAAKLRTEKTALLANRDNDLRAFLRWVSDENRMALSDEDIDSYISDYRAENT